MPIDVEKMIHACRDIVEAQENQQGLGNGAAIRQPDRPMAFVFLGEHPKGAREATERALRRCWPQNYQYIPVRAYRTPEDFSRAMDYYDDDHMELEDTISQICQADSRFNQNTNVHLIYFLNLNGEDVSDFLDALNQPDPIRLGGLKTRYICAVFHCSRGRDYKRSHQQLTRLQELAVANERNVWGQSHIIALSDMQYDRATLSDEQFLENYAIVPELLLLLNSVPLKNENRLITLTYDPNNFITGAVQRIQKPTDDIVRAVLQRYVQTCRDLCTRDRHNGQGVDEGAALKEYCRRLMQSFYEREIAPMLPAGEELAGLPNGAATPQDVGMTGGVDRTFGIWAAYQKKHYINAIKEKPGLKEALHSYFEQGLRTAYNCAGIQAQFQTLEASLDNGTDPLQFSADWQPRRLAVAPFQALYEENERAAMATFAAIAYTVLKNVVSDLLEEARRFVALLDDLQGLLAPHYKSVETFYQGKTTVYLDKHTDPEETSPQLSSSWSESEFEARMKRFLKRIAGQDFMHYSFEQELQQRIGIQQANQQVQNMLAISEDAMRGCARITADGKLIKAVALVDPRGAYANAIMGSSFSVSRSDCVEYLAFYRFDVAQMT